MPGQQSFRAPGTNMPWGVSLLPATRVNGVSAPPVYNNEATQYSNTQHINPVC